jgi:catechol 2,3-dioxygenase-like lactoylglutathione lyase family enzyme
MTTMSRVQLALNVDDLDEAIRFYSKLFNTEPAKVKPGYANFAVAEPPLKLVLIENPGHGGTLNHLGVEVESGDKVHQEITRFAGEGMFPEEQIGTTCCYAAQDKVWVTGPAGERWEVYTVLSDSETFDTSSDLLAAEVTDGCSCSGDNASDASSAARHVCGAATGGQHPGDVARPLKGFV